MVIIQTFNVDTYLDAAEAKFSVRIACSDLLIHTLLLWKSAYALYVASISLEFSLTLRCTLLAAFVQFTHLHGA